VLHEVSYIVTQNTFALQCDSIRIESVCLPVTPTLTFQWLAARSVSRDITAGVHGAACLYEPDIARKEKNVGRNQESKILPHFSSFVNLLRIVLSVDTGTQITVVVNGYEIAFVNSALKFDLCFYLFEKRNSKFNNQ
jgi:hypothetical protein